LTEQAIIDDHIPTALLYQFKLLTTIDSHGGWFGWMDILYFLSLARN
jgi:hypothetical protein